MTAFGHKAVVIMLAGKWLCWRCGANGFLPARAAHKPRCRGGKRPITWSPPPFLIERAP